MYLCFPQHNQIFILVQSSNRHQSQFIEAT
jgi:hypothetical protein